MLLAVVEAVRVAFGSPQAAQLEGGLISARLIELVLGRGSLKLRSAASSALSLDSLRPTLDAIVLSAAIDELDAAARDLSYADAVHMRALRANVRRSSSGATDSAARRASNFVSIVYVAPASSSDYRAKCSVHEPSTRRR